MYSNAEATMILWLESQNATCFDAQECARKQWLLYYNVTSNLQAMHLSPWQFLSWVLYIYTGDRDSSVVLHI